MKHDKYPGMFDPAEGPDRNIRRHHLQDANMLGSVPKFIDVHGMRQTVRNWNGTLRFTLTVAQRALENKGLLEQVSGVEIRPGKESDGFSYVQSLDASVRRLSSDMAIRAIQRTVAALHLPFQVRFGCPEASRKDEVAKFVPHPAKIPILGGLYPYRRGYAPGLKSHDPAPSPDMELIRIKSRIDEGRILQGSRICISIEGVVREGNFLITPGQGNPQKGWLGDRSPIAAAIMGHRAGDECHYDVGPKSRRIQIHDVDNAALAIAHGLFDLPVARPAPESGPSL